MSDDLIQPEASPKMHHKVSDAVEHLLTAWSPQLSPIVFRTWVDTDEGRRWFEISIRATDRNR